MKRSLGTKLYYSIGEVAELTQLKPYTLRAWENEFSCLRPKRVHGKNRAYREREIGIILLIKRLLYRERYSTRGAQQRLKNEPELVRVAAQSAASLLEMDELAVDSVAGPVSSPVAPEATAPTASARSAEVISRENVVIPVLLKDVLSELREIVKLLQ